ncbi:LysR family transcriptional regulator [Anaerocolumna cellulosilytica]|uniref:LysR family transcriptional regulator n=1 Tax=Anaerocolumna cellulosilytica TaxID=433286 RepID=A0A6S6R9V6_9FIRM|nr:LysR family transcriptional regulator [Anaerocolumna cellulosilytica]MBB5196628.1 DNA-binding transcriptional LysR family regulator [Anaerocolumna cellulosilytica]BCJ95728.1 LysR family transcriptional regulator [Anaerocolumna cellulosilytica]
MDFNLTNYKIFNTVASTGNISHAAKELYISQPAISKAISKLEESLGVPLFIRSSRGVRLTGEGEILYEYTKSAFLTLSQGERNLRRIHELGMGHLRIGVSATLCKYILLPYLKNFVLTYPHVKVSIECQSTFKTLELLEQNKIDIGLIGLPEDLKNLDFYPVKKIEDIFVATKSYLENLRLRESSVMPAYSSINNESISLPSSFIFKTANIMLLDEKNMTRLFIDNYFTKNQIETNQILEISNMDLLIEFAKISLGVSCVIKEFVETELKQELLVEIPLENPLKAREIGFAYKKSAQLTQTLEKFIQFYRTTS